MPVKWESKLDVKLLCQVIKIFDGQVTGDNWTKIAEAMGQEFTAKACRLHFAKILKDIEDGTQAPVTDESAASPAPGQKRKTKGESTSQQTPKKSKKPSTPRVKREDGGDQSSTSTD